MTQSYLDIECGDLRAVLPTLAEATFDAVVTDPPYELGFMGKAWDRSGVAFDAATWREVLRVLKPGAHLVAFGGTRTWHRIAVAIEDAGFEIRDNLAWLYGQGFPKSLDVSKAIDAAAGAERPVVGTRVLKGSAALTTAEKGGTYASNTDSRGRERTIDVTAAATPEAQQWQGWGTGLKPSFEPIILARKPLEGRVADNVLRYGTGALHIDACRGEGGKGVPGSMPKASSASGHLPGIGERPPGPGQDPNVGRWPPNVIVDELVAADLDASFGTHKAGKAVTRNGGGGKVFNGSGPGEPRPDGGYTDTGGVSRYFYCPKAGSKERDAGLEHWPALGGGEATGRKEGSAGTKNPRAGAGRGGGRRNPHPTVKPIELMRWLVRLVTPPGGLILDPFAGAGTTICAAALEGFDAAGIELLEEHARLARDRVAYWEPRRAG